MKKNKSTFYLPIILAIFSIIIYAFLNMPSSSKSVSYLKFNEMLEKNAIRKVIINNTEKVTFIDNEDNHFYTSNPRSESFKEDLLLRGIDVSESTEKPLSETIPLSMLLASIGMFIFFTLKNRKFSPKGVFSQGNLNLQDHQNINITFDDVAGNIEAKESLRDIIDFLQNPDKYRNYGARMPKGVMFYGEPGTGKTLLAKAVAGEANVPFFAVSGSDFVQMYVGVGASRIRSLFKQASAHGKAVIFIDEIDAIGKQRSNGTSGSSEEKDQTLNALLTEMSGFNEKTGIIVIAATNRFDMLDNALLRPGRFDRHVEIQLPDVNARKKILNLYLDKKPTSSIDVDSWAKKTACFSGARIENFINEAAILACKDNLPNISTDHLEKAFTTLLAGSPKSDYSYVTQKDRSITAYHEIGHALASMILLPNEEINKVSIIPSTKGAGGFTHSIPEDKMYYSKNYIHKKLMVFLAGRAAEEILLGPESITTGAHNDFEKATALAIDSITKYGMGTTLGKLSSTELSKRGISLDGQVVKESRELLDTLYDDVLSLLKNNMKTLDSMSALLMDKEILYKESLYECLYKHASESIVY